MGEACLDEGTSLGGADTETMAFIPYAIRDNSAFQQNLLDGYDTPRLKHTRFIEIEILETYTHTVPRGRMQPAAGTMLGDSTVDQK